MLLSTVKDEFVFHCQSRNLSPKTTKNYRKQIEYLLNYLAAEYQVTHIEDVKPEHIKTFLVKMKVSHKVNYINDLLKAFKVFFKYAHAEGYTDTLVTEKISNMKKPKVLIRTFSEAELKRLSNYYQGYTYLQLRNRVMLLLLIDTGIRMSELIGLTVEQLKYDYILIRGKGNKERVVPKSPTLSKWLLKFLTVRKSYFDLIILDEAHSLVTDATFTDSPFYVMDFLNWVYRHDKHCKIILLIQMEVIWDRESRRSSLLCIKTTQNIAK